MLTLRYVLVDVFTDRPLAGNPLAVFTAVPGLIQGTMQALARELNLSETTFVSPAENGGTARVRIFTPRAEIPFAGHPTLGTALVLGGSLNLQKLTLELSVGPVPVVLERHPGQMPRGWFSRPAPTHLTFNATDELLAALGVMRTASPPVVYDNGVRHAVIHLDSKADVGALQPDLGQLAQLPVDTIDVFAFDGNSALLRVFAPAHGISEDPATGSAAAPVFGHLVKHGALDPLATLSICQGEHLHRPSLIMVRQSPLAQGASQVIEVGGAGVVVGGGEFLLPSNIAENLP